MNRFSCFFIASLFFARNTAAQNCSIFAGNDTVLCPLPDTLQLNAQPGMPIGVCSFVEWIPATGLSDPNILDPLAYISSPITYTVTACLPFEPNLVVNGDFEAGNTGFSNTYTYNCPFGGILQEDEYCVTTDPQNVHTGAMSCSDHTSGSGMMLVVNGATTVNSNVWQQTIVVQPNTYYQFSFWVTNWSSFTNFLPTFDIEVNGISQGLSLEINPTQCSWKEECLLWYSDAATSATFKIIDQVDYYGGNDFSFDDITLQEACFVTDTIVISSGTISQVWDTTVCEGSLVTLTAENGSGYSWSPAAGLSCNTCQSVSFTADSTITYYASISGNDCDLMDTFIIAVDSLPDLVLSNDTFLCLGNSLQMNAQSGSPVTWSPATSLSCTICSDPVASPLVTTIYIASVSNGVCVMTDSVTLTVATISPVILPPDTTICHGNGLLLSIDSGYSDYNWFPVTGLSCSDCPETIVDPDSAITYTVVVSDSGCIAQDSISIMVNYTDEVYAGQDDSICNGESVQLLATGTSSYSWSPSGFLNDETINNPVATPSVTTSFVVNGSDACGETSDAVIVFVFDNPVVLVSYDSIIFCHTGTEIILNSDSGVNYFWQNPGVPDPFSSHNFVDPDSDVTYTIIASNAACDTTLKFTLQVSGADIVIPTAFTPNNDGTNDFFFILPSCPISLDYFRIFNRWGSLIFETSDINGKWNGMYKGDKCDMGVYVYVVSGKRLTGENIIMKGNVTLIK